MRYPELIDFFKHYEPEGNIIDLGCGQGRDSISQAKLGYKVTGIDNSKVGIDQMNTISKKERLIMAKRTEESGNLLTVPGVGKSIAHDLHILGIHHVKDLKGQDPEALFNDLCAEYKKKIDRCVLYTFRCAVYYAENETHDPSLLKWWNWKDRTK